MLKKSFAGAVIVVGLLSAGATVAPAMAVAGPCQPGVTKDCKDTKKQPPCQPGVTKDCKYKEPRR
ncbi:hypothetical protein ACFXNW_24970 [Nocardia sp. NPDC059180]|uniref:hypothetical protein n=1 Tax=Nocardia sp. NPDC059180 TaxID=3346761 RepID=UPI0036A25A54